MKCREFRRRFHAMLDVNQPRQFAGEMADHIRSCPDCVTHVEEMEFVDAALRNAPEIEFPADLARKLEEIPQRYEEKFERQAWGKGSWHAAAIVVPVALMAILAIASPPDFRFAVQTAIATYAFLAIALQRIDSKT